MPFFSDMGLVAEGRDASRQFEQRLSDEKQGAQLRDQAIESGNMGLEDARRERGTQAKARAAGAASGSVTDSLSNMARVHLESGDPVTANKYMDAAKNMQAEGIVDVAKLVLTKPQSGYRPDVAQAMNAKGAHKIYDNPQNPDDPNNAQFDGKGTLMVTDQRTGKREPWNMGQVAVLTGLVKPPTIHNIPQGGKGVVMQPGQEPRVIDNPKVPDHPLNSNFGHETTTDSEGNVVSRPVDLRTMKPGESQPAAAPGPGNIRKDLPVIKEIADAVKERDGMFESKSDPANPLAPPMKVLTKKGEQTAIIASQIWQSNKNMDPNTVVNIASKGRLVRNESTGALAWESNGQRYKINVPNGEQVPVAPPAPKARTQNDLPKPAAGTQADAPAGAPPVQTVSETPSQSTGTAQEIVAKEGLPGLQARLEKLYPPKDTVGGGRAGATKRKVDSPEVAKFKQMKGRAALDYADSLLGRKQTAGLSG